MFLPPDPPEILAARVKISQYNDQNSAMVPVFARDCMAFKKQISS